MLTSHDFCIDWPQIDAIEGWLSRESAALMDYFLACQDKANLPGTGLLEIGVWKGRSAALMARHLRTAEDMWLLDSWPQQEDVKKSLAVVLGERIQQHGITLFQARRGKRHWRFRRPGVTGISMSMANTLPPVCAQIWCWPDASWNTPA
jgi:hypothetical protein